MRSLTILLVCMVVVNNCHAERFIKFHERMSAEEIVEIFSQSDDPVNSVQNLRKSGHGLNCGKFLSINNKWFSLYENDSFY